MVLPAGNLPSGQSYNGGRLPAADGDTFDDTYTGQKTTARWTANLTRLFAGSATSAGPLYGAADDLYTGSKQIVVWIANIVRLAAGSVNSVWKDANGTVVAKLSDSANVSAAENLKTANAHLTTLEGYVDGLETLGTAHSTKLDTLHTDLGTIDGHVDGLEANTASSAADDLYTGSKLIAVWLGNATRLLAGSVAGALRGQHDDAYTAADRNLVTIAANATRLLAGSVAGALRGQADDAYTAADRNLSVMTANIMRLVSGTVAGTLRGQADDAYTAADRNASVMLANIMRLLSGSATTTNTLYNATSAKSLASQMNHRTAAYDDIAKVVGANTTTIGLNATTTITGPARLFGYDCIGITAASYFRDGGAGGAARILVPAQAAATTSTVVSFPGGIPFTTNIYLENPGAGGGWITFWYSA